MYGVIFKISLLFLVSEAVFNVKLGKDSQFFWQLNYGSEEFTAEIHTKNFYEGKSWVGIGFSNYGNFSDSSGDFCVVWQSKLKASRRHGYGISLKITDVHISKNSEIIVDEKQDCENFQYAIENETLRWTFKRKFVTCDLNDYALEEGTTHLHWIKGDGPLYDINGVRISGVSDSGFKRVRFLKNIEKHHERMPQHAWNFTVLNSKVKVAPIETTYWCQVAKLPEDILKQRHHVIQFGPRIQPGNEELVHHMEVFHCLTQADVEIPLYAGVCNEAPKELKVCSRVIGAWAMGADPLKYPPEAGFPIGGEGFNPYVRLEMHYNNPGLKPDWVDSSGMEFWVTNKLRQYDAGIIELGLEYTDKMAIPPGQERFQLTGVCNTECTSVGLPPRGIEIFASQLHTHLTGTRVVTRHFRPEKGDSGSYDQLPFLNWDNHYSTHYQEIRQLKIPRRVIPGDVLLTTCEFNTLARERATLGGFAISDEMCVNYVHYYPRSALEVCKSSVAMKDLIEYFSFMQGMEGQNSVQPEGPISENYHNIQWTPFRAKILADFYNKSPIDMQCNQSNGARFPGNWDRMDVPLFPDLEHARNPNECLDLPIATSIEHD